jgi:hypothetical protein
MNKFILLCFLFCVKVLVSQSPQHISYQGVARNASGSVLSNTTIAVKFEIHHGSATGTIVFTEQHQGTLALITNSFGLFTTAIGSVSSLNVVNWTNGPFFMEVSIDPANGTAYTSVGTQQLMSVPYALYAEKAGNASPTPTITINAPNTVINSADGSYSITIPGSTTYSAGTGISISGGVISNTLLPVTPTLTGSGQAVITSTSTGVYEVSVPSQSLAISGNSISISSGNTLVLPENTFMAGNSNLAINKVGYDYTLTAVTPTLNVSGGTLTGAYPLQTLTIPSSSTSLTQGNNVTLNQNGSSYTVSAVTPTLNVNGGTLNGAYPLQTLTIPSSSTSLVQGSNVTLNQSGNTYTINAATNTLTAGNQNITLNQSGNNYTITPVTPTLNVNGGTLNGAYPSQTLTIPSSSTSLVQGTNVTLNQSGNTYTINAATNTLTAGNPNIILNQSGNNYTITPVTPTLNVNGGNLSGAYPSQTLTIPSSSTSLVQGTNVTLNQSGNTYTISSITPTLTAGSNVTITPTGPSNAYTITAAPTSSYTGAAGNIAVSGTTINLAQTGVTTGTYGSNTGNAVPTFSVDNFGRLVTAGQYTTTLSGDVIGTVNTSTVSRLRGVPVSASTPTLGQVLQYTGSAWTPTTIAMPWSLTGNAGITGANFIGTTDNFPFRIRTNNTVKAVVTETGQLVVGNTSGYSANSKLVVFDGHIESMQATAPVIAGAGSLLGLVGSNAALSANSTDVSGTIVVTIGLLGGGKGSYATITFNKPYGTPPVIILTPRSEDAALLSAYVTGTTANGFTIGFSGTTAGLTAYEFNYMIME